MAFATGGECLILDDDELDAAAKKPIDWRRGNSFELRSLFRTVATPPQFQMTRKFPAPGTHMGKFPFQRQQPPAEKSEGKIARPPVQPAASQEFKPLMEVDWNPTPEEIAEFGVPLLPLPPWRPEASSARPLPLRIGEGGMPEEDLDHSIYYFEDGDPRYAACTPPPERLRVGEEETTASTVDAKHVVGLGPDVHCIIGDLRQCD